VGYINDVNYLFVVAVSNRPNLPHSTQDWISGVTNLSWVGLFLLLNGSWHAAATTVANRFLAMQTFWDPWNKDFSIVYVDSWFN
jgi:hypothetical protein